MSVLDGPLAFVDIETTGLSYRRDRVIEVAAIRVENGQISAEFSSLVDPQMALPPYISQLTGIREKDLAGAPTFSDIAGRLYEMLGGAVFVAHNVRFDYGFLKNEFKAAGCQFSPKLLCTMKLSRALYPAAGGHKLHDLIGHCGLAARNRHRAYDDAQVLWQFIQHTSQSFPAPVVESAIKRQIRTPSLPRKITPDIMESLPEAPGVYIFQDEAGKPLYIGKSINIRKRVMSHFSADHSFESEFKITQQVADIATIVTGGDLSALLLESRLIKDQQPLYNRQLRRTRKMTLARQFTNDDGFISLTIEDVSAIEPDKIGDILGVYSTKSKARQFLDQIIKDYYLCPRLMGLEKGRGACFAYQLKKCRGACHGLEPAIDYNQRLLTAFEDRRLQEWPFKSPVIIREDGDNVSGALAVDKWCVLAEISQQTDCEPVIKTHGKLFDLDTYKILRGYLSAKRHLLDIKPISQANLNQLIAAG